jgi:hypothetical protein
MPTPTELDYAWAAGIVDGEGCISVYKQKSGWTLYVRVNMTEPNTIAELPMTRSSIMLPAQMAGARPIWPSRLIPWRRSLCRIPMGPQ